MCQDDKSLINSDQYLLTHAVNYWKIGTGFKMSPLQN